MICKQSGATRRERDRRGGGCEETRSPRRGMRQETRSRWRTGEKDPALKNADEAEVKESPHASEISSRSLITVLVHLTVIFVCSRPSCPRLSIEPRSSNSRRCTRDLGALTLTLELVPSTEFLLFISVTPWLDARRDFYGTPR